MEQQSVLELVHARTGHFLLESGYHGALWLDLDPLFADGRRIAPLVRSLAARIRAQNPTMICGPMIGGAFLAQLLAQTMSIEFCYTAKSTDGYAGGLFQTRYSLSPAFYERVRGSRIALVDDAMSAGSSLRASFDEITRRGGIPVAVGALLVLGQKGEEFFRSRSIPVETDERRDYQVWEPADCPMCAAGTPLEQTFGR